MIARLNMGGPAHQAALLSGRRFFPDRYESLLVHGSLPPDEGSLAHLAEREGARMHQVREFVRPVRPAADSVALARLVAVLRRFRPQIVHTHTAKAGFLGRLAAILAGGSRPPLLVHTYHGHVLDGYFGPARSAVFRGLERALAQRTDVLIGVSQATVDDLVRLGIAAPERFCRVPLGLELGPFAAIDAGARAGARERLGLRPEETVCTYVGRFAPVKRLDLLLSAFAEARAGDPGLHLVLVGDGEPRAELERLAGRLEIAGSVRFLGYRDDLATVWAASDLAVLSSADEGTPVALIEAAAAGVPAVATDVGGVRETLDPGASALVPFGDTHAMGRAILGYAADRQGRERAGAIARSDALARFGVERLIADIDRLYAELLARRAGREARVG